MIVGTTGYPVFFRGSRFYSFAKQGALKNLDEKHCDHPAIDQALANEAYEMVKGGVKPFGDDYEFFLTDSTYAKKISFEEESTLFPPKTYVFKIRLELGANLIHSERFYGQATGRSSVGRVDVLTRLIVNGMDEYEGFNPAGLLAGSDGKLFLEVTPITFPVVVRPGVTLSQLRLFLGSPTTALMDAKDICRTALLNAEPAMMGI